MNRLIPVFVSICLVSACAEEPQSTPAGKSPAAIEKFVLAQDPGDALSITKAKEAGPQKGVVVVGRVHDITKGFAMLKLMDASLNFCGQVNKSDKCPTPWDYCCDSKDERVANSLLVELRGADGKPLTTAAIPKTRHCDLMKVKGDLVKDTHGNLVMVADGIWQAERPTLPDYVKWPR